MTAERRLREYIANGTVREGRLLLEDKRSLQFALQQMAGPVVVTITKAHATRSLEQNAVYFAGFVTPLAEAFGWTVNDMHAYLKQRFLPQHKRRVKTLLLHDQRTGEVIDEFEIDLSSTTQLNKKEFSDYLRDIQVWAAEHNVRVGSNREDAA